MRLPTRVLNQAVRRNLRRFPEEFMFQLTMAEASALRSQTVTLTAGRGRHSKYAPLAFTEYGMVMLSSVLNSDRDIQMNILIIRTFLRLREMIAANRDLVERIVKLEANQRDIGSILDALVDEIENMKALPPPSKRKIGFDL
jgi:predicted AAA+ superfamily ATPase